MGPPGCKSSNHEIVGAETWGQRRGVGREVDRMEGLKKQYPCGQIREVGIIEMEHAHQNYSITWPEMFV